MASGGERASATDTDTTIPSMVARDPSLMGFLDKLRGKPTTTPGSVIDPVCGMTIDAAKAAGTSEHGAKKYYFCSPGCKSKFDADPHQFLGAHSH
jgi:Cu+-exporting ATPase